MNTNRINGYGAILRFITPLLLAIALFILKDIKSDLREVKQSFTNHLEHHRTLEVQNAERLSCIESKINFFLDRYREGR